MGKILKYLVFMYWFNYIFRSVLSILLASNSWNFEFGYLQSILPIREHGSGETYYLNKGQYNSVITFTLVKSFGNKTEKSE